MKIEFFKHNLGREEKESVFRVLDSVFLTSGEVVDEFERNLAQYVGAHYCVGLMSCTAALHLALLALDIGPGDEVITTPMTSAHLSILYTVQVSAVFSSGIK